jgi:hypothetical protein
MAEKSSSTIPIIVAAIGVLGTISAALIANWDKLSGGRATGQPSQAVAEHANGAAPPPASHDAGVGADPAVPGVVDLAGTWVDADGYEYVFEQTGTHYRFRQLKAGTQIGSGDGSLVGHSFNHKFTGVFGDGRCVGEVSGDGNVSSGTCTDGPNTWDMRVVRSAAAKS